MKRKQNYDDVPSAQGGGSSNEERKNARSALNYVAVAEESKIDTIKPVKFDIQQFLNDYFK
jgi:hypothetical protein